MKKILFVMMIAVLLVVLGACGGAEDRAVDNEVAPESTPVAETEAPEAGKVTGDFDTEAAEGSYKVCSNCHGDDLQGKNQYPAITGRTKNEVLTVIQEGAPGMPKNMVSGEAAENLAAWIAAHQ